MVDTVSYESEILEELQRLNADQKRQVLDYMRSLNRPKGEPGWQLVQHAREIQFPHEDLEEMRIAIEEECERIDLDEWDKPIFTD
jgi:hypothetical protein